MEKSKGTVRYTPEILVEVIQSVSVSWLLVAALLLELSAESASSLRQV